MLSFRRLHDSRSCLSTALFVFAIAQHSFAAPCPIEFELLQDQPTSAVGLQIGDFNGDLNLDVVGPGNTCAIMHFGNGDGTLGPPTGVSCASSFSLTTITAADAINDGKLDLIAVSQFARTVYVARGNGNGTFQATVAYATGFSPDTAAISLINNDPYPDLVVSNTNDHNLTLYFGTVTGDFLPGGTISTGTFSLPGDIAVADVNGDGRQDVLLTNKSASTPGVTVMLGSAAGVLVQGANWSTDNGPQALVLTDLNRDSKLDVITANFFSNTISVLLGNGDGTFRPQTHYPVGTNPFDLAVGDLNGDGMPDVVVANINSNSISVYSGDASGALLPQATVFPSGSPYAVAIADLNRDGKPDLIVSRGNRLLVYANRSPSLSITQQPQSHVAQTGESVVFSVAVSSGPEITYQWRKNGVNLVDDGRIDGAYSETLTIHDAMLGDAGKYTVFITNPCGSLTSAPANLRLYAVVDGPPSSAPIETPIPN